MTDPRHEALAEALIAVVGHDGPLRTSRYTPAEFADAILAHLPMSQAERDGLALARLPKGCLVGQWDDESGWAVFSYNLDEVKGSGPTIEAAVNAARGDET